jgi:hypothetical protein
MPILNPDKFPIVIADEASRATYIHRAMDITPVATATDVLALSGSATKKVKITRIKVMVTATAAACLDLYISKRTAANSGGTFTNPAATPLDSTNPAATATLTLYSANPTALGTGTGVEGTILIVAASGNPVDHQEYEHYFGLDNTQPLVLNGVAESVSINFGGAAIPAGAKAYMLIEWTEEPLS